MKVDPNKPKTAFLFYASTLDALEELPKEQQGKVALTLLDFAFRDDVTAPFDCPDDEWMVLSQIFEGIEAERLMGFPDFWTQYGHEGREISDSKRYSMLGNSIAVPCVAYIMQGIRDVLLGEEVQ